MKLIITDNAVLPAVSENQRGKLLLKRTSGVEDEVYVGLDDGSAASLQRRVLTEEYANGLYTPIGHDHAGVYLPLAGGGTVVGPLVVLRDNAFAYAFYVLDEDSRKTFVVSTGYHEVSVVSGATLQGFSGDMVGQTWEIDSSSGNAQFDGTGAFTGALSAAAITGNAITGSSFNSPLMFAASNSYIQGAQPTHADNTTYEDVSTVSVVLGTGTWTVLVWGHISASIAGSLDWRARVRLGSSNGTALTTDISADDYHTINCTGTFTGQTGTLTAAIAYQPVTNLNTVTVGSSSIFAFAMRTS